MKQLPEGFLWGGATADFQYEGGFNEGGRGLLSHDFETDGSMENPRHHTLQMPDGTILKPRSSFFYADPVPNEAKPVFLDDEYYPSHQAVDFYHRYKEDIALMAEMGFNVFRFSICWSRIYPLGDEEIPNEEGLKFYDEVISELEKHHMEPLITICHDEMPMHLALKYGGFTSLDKVYLQNTLSDLSDNQKLAFITPPPSVINAYFAEIYQKQSPEAATDYYLELSKELNLFNPVPSFDEHKPFIRLNLSGKSYGFCYENADEVALVFAEHLEVPTTDILFELAQVFPQYKVYLEGTQVKMAKVDFDEEVLEELTPETQLLSRVTKLKGNVIKLASFNQDELVELLSQYKDKGQTVYYGFAQRECLAYIVQK